jgi:hypothetical protein
MSDEVTVPRWDHAGSRLAFMVSSAAHDSVRLPTPAGSSPSGPSAGQRRKPLAKTLRLVADPTRLQALSMINASRGQEWP